MEIKKENFEEGKMGGKAEKSFKANSLFYVLLLIIFDGIILYLVLQTGNYPLFIIALLFLAEVNSYVHDKLRLREDNKVAASEYKLSDWVQEYLRNNYDWLIFMFLFLFVITVIGNKFTEFPLFVQIIIALFFMLGLGYFRLKAYKNRS